MDIAVFGLLILIAFSASIFHIMERQFGEVKNPLFIMTNTYFITLILMGVVNLIAGTTINEMISAISLPVLCVAFGDTIYNTFLALSYGKGAKISTIFNIITIASSIILVFIGLTFLSENFAWYNGIGVAFAMAGVYFMTGKEAKNEK